MDNESDPQPLFSSPFRLDYHAIVTRTFPSGKNVPSTRALEHCWTFNKGFVLVRVIDLSREKKIIFLRHDKDEWPNINAIEERAPENSGFVAVQVESNPTVRFLYLALELTKSIKKLLVQACCSV